MLTLLREAGCLHPTRTAGSHGGYDITAPFPEFTFLIQCKAYKPTAADREACRSASEGTAARWALVSWHEGKMGVECWKGGKPWKIIPPGLGG